MGKIVTPGGGGGADTSIVTASADDILLNQVIVDKDGNPLTGTMPNNGAVAPSALGAGGSYTIPEGYHNGSGKVTVQTLATMTSAGDATAAQILSGKKAYVDGSLLTGTLAIQSAISFSAAARSSTAIRISWKNPSKGPWTGVKIRMSTSGSPGVSGGTLKYTGTGSSTTAGATSYVDITGLTPGTTHYFTCYSYVTGLGDSTSGYNCSAKTSGLLLYNYGANPANYRAQGEGYTLNSDHIRGTNTGAGSVLSSENFSIKMSSYTKLYCYIQVISNPNGGIKVFFSGNTAASTSGKNQKFTGKGTANAYYTIAYKISSGASTVTTHNLMFNGGKYDSDGEWWGSDNLDLKIYRLWLE